MACKLEGLITVPTGGWEIKVTVQSDPEATVTIPAGTYYLSSVGSGSRSLIDEVSYQMNATGNYFAVTMSAAGLVTIGRGNSWVASFTSTGLRDALGFTGNLTPSALSFTGTEQAEYLFLPNCGRGPSFMSPDGDDGAEESDLTMAVSPSGVVRCYGYERRAVDSLDFPHLKSSKTWISDEVTANESLQRFWRATMASGARFRYHPDATAAGTYVTWVAEAPEFKPAPLVPGWDNAAALWSWGCRVRKYV